MDSSFIQYILFRVSLSQSSKRQQPKIQSELPHIKNGQQNPKEEKSPQNRQIVRDTPTPLLGLTKETNSYKTYTEKLVQTLTGPIFASSISLSPQEPW